MAIDFNGVGAQTAPAARFSPPSWSEVQSRALNILKANGFIDINDVEANNGNDWTRCRTENKPNKKNGYYTIFFDSHPTIVFGIHGYLEQTWEKLYDSTGISVSSHDYKAEQEARERHRQILAETKKKQADQAAVKAVSDLAQGRDVQYQEHPYLMRKDVFARPGLKIKRCRKNADEPEATPIFEDALLVPLQNVKGEIRSYQRIFPDGTKKNLFHGDKSGVFYMITGSGNRTGQVCVCEGYATAATIAEALSSVDVCSVCTADNFDPVLQAVKDAGQLDPAKTLLVYDNDWDTARRLYDRAKADGKAEGKTVDDFNPGKKAALAAAAKFGCRAVSAVPDDCIYSDGTDGSDANDLFLIAKEDSIRVDIQESTARQVGLEAVKAMLLKGWAQPLPQAPVAPAQSQSSSFDFLEHWEESACGNMYRGDAPPYDWAIKDLGERGTLAVLAGGGGLGKSTMGCQAVAAVATGMSWLGTWETGEPEKAIYLSSEDSSRELHRRYKAICSTMPDKKLKLLNEFAVFQEIRGHSNLLVQDSKSLKVVPQDLWYRFYEHICKIKPSLIIIDPISSVTTVNENDNTAMTDALIYWEDLARESNAMIIYLHHTTKTVTMIKNTKDIAPNMVHSAIRGAGAIVNRPRLAMLGYPIAAEIANTMVESTEAPFRFDGELLCFKDVKKNCGPLGPVRYFRHTANKGLLIPCCHIKEEIAYVQDRQLLKEQREEQELDKMARRLAQEVVRREQVLGQVRVSQSGVYQALGRGRSTAKSAPVVERAVDLGLVHRVGRAELRSRNFGDKISGNGGGDVLVPSFEAMKTYGTFDPDRVEGFQNVPDDFVAYVREVGRGRYEAKRAEDIAAQEALQEETPQEEQ